MSLYDEARKQLEEEQRAKQAAEEFNRKRELSEFKEKIEKRLVDEIKKGPHLVELEVLIFSKDEVEKTGETQEGNIFKKRRVFHFEVKPNDIHAEQISFLENICVSSGIKIDHYFLDLSRYDRLTCGFGGFVYSSKGEKYSIPCWPRFSREYWPSDIKFSIFVEV